MTSEIRLEIASLRAIGIGAPNRKWPTTVICIIRATTGQRPIEQVDGGWVYLTHYASSAFLLYQPRRSKPLVARSARKREGACSPQTESTSRLMNRTPNEIGRTPATGWPYLASQGVEGVFQIEPRKEARIASLLLERLV